MKVTSKIEVLKEILGSNTRYFGNKAVFAMTNGNIAEITLGNENYVDHYYGLIVAIKNKIDGEVTRNYFRFDDYLKDIDSSHPNSSRVSRLYIWASTMPKHKEFDWYILRPKGENAQPIVDAIFEFIEMYDS
jgi:hypothetical protein